MTTQFWLAILLLGFLPLSASAQIDYDDDGVSLIEEEDEYEAKPKRRKRRKKKRRREAEGDYEIKEAVDVWKSPGRSKRRKRPSFEEEFEPGDGDEFSWERTPRGNDFFGNVENIELKAGEIGGEVHVEARAFEQFTATEETVDKNLGLFLRGEASFESSSEVWAAKIRAGGRFGALDSDRNRVFPEDVWVSYAKGFSQLRAGFQIFTWSQMDIFTAAELLNSVNFDSEVENLEKIGELALTWNLKLAIGFVELIYMPMVWSPNFPGAKSRFNVLDPGDAIGEPIYVKKDGSLVEGQQFHQFAARLSRTIGTADVVFFIVDQVDRRSPEVVFQNSSESFRPVFFPITSFGLSVVYAVGDYLLKLESLRRLVTNPVQPTIFGTLKKQSHSVLALGIEKEMEWFGKPVTAFLEHQRLFGLDDEISDLDRQKLSSFQNDIAFGARINFNDLNGQELRLLLDVDLDVSSQILGSVTYSRRLWESWRLKLGYRHIRAEKQNIIAVGLEQFDRDNFFDLQLIRFF